jgi:hypothetical protein
MALYPAGKKVLCPRHTRMTSIRCEGGAHDTVHGKNNPALPVQGCDDVWILKQLVIQRNVSSPSSGWEVSTS